MKRGKKQGFHIFVEKTIAQGDRPNNMAENTPTLGLYSLLPSSYESNTAIVLIVTIIKDAEVTDTPSSQ
jgi:hypothetical protein